MYTASWDTGPSGSADIEYGTSKARRSSARQGCHETPRRGIYTDCSHHPPSQGRHAYNASRTSPRSPFGLETAASSSACSRSSRLNTRCPWRTVLLTAACGVTTFDTSIPTSSVVANRQPTLLCPRHHFVCPRRVHRDNSRRSKRGSHNPYVQGLPDAAALLTALFSSLFFGL